jgi:hypothetical protein
VGMNNRVASFKEAGRLLVPDSCRMYGGFTEDRDVCIVFGNAMTEPSVVFERYALERFARLAHELLAVPIYEEQKPESLPVLVSPSDGDNPEIPNLAAGENSLFIRELQKVSELMGRYACWLLDPKAADVEAFPFEEQMLLSVRLAVLGHGVREVALRGEEEG